MEDIPGDLPYGLLRQHHAVPLTIPHYRLETLITVLHDHKQPGVLDPAVMVSHDISAFDIGQRRQCLHLIKILLDGFHDFDGVDTAVDPVPAFLDDAEAPRPQRAELFVVGLESGVLVVVGLQPVLLLLVLLLYGALQVAGAGPFGRGAEHLGGLLLFLDFADTGDLLFEGRGLFQQLRDVAAPRGTTLVAEHDLLFLSVGDFDGVLIGLGSGPAREFALEDLVVLPPHLHNAGILLSLFLLDVHVNLNLNCRANSLIIFDSGIERSLGSSPSDRSPDALLGVGIPREPDIAVTVRVAHWVSVVGVADGRAVYAAGRGAVLRAA